jgi:hypothetical protein
MNNAGIRKQFRPNVCVKQLWKMTKVLQPGQAIPEPEYEHRIFLNRAKILYLQCSPIDECQQHFQAKKKISFIHYQQLTV